MVLLEDEQRLARLLNGGLLVGLELGGHEWPCQKGQKKGNGAGETTHGRIIAPRPGARRSDDALT